MKELKKRVSWHLGADDVYTFTLELAGEAIERLLLPKNNEDLRNVRDIMDEIEQMRSSFKFN